MHVSVHIEIVLIFDSSQMLQRFRPTDEDEFIDHFYRTVVTDDVQVDVSFSWKHTEIEKETNIKNNCLRPFII